MPFLLKLIGELTSITIPHLFLLHAYLSFTKKFPDLFPLLFNLVFLVVSRAALYETRIPW